MNLVRWHPWGELEEMTDPLNCFFAHPDTRRSNSKDMLTVEDWAPFVDISETDEEFHVKAELPVLKKEDARVTLDKGMLTLQGEWKEA